MTQHTEEYRIKPIGDPVTYAIAIEQRNAAGVWVPPHSDSVLSGTFPDSPAALAAIEKHRAATKAKTGVMVFLPGDHAPIVQGPDKLFRIVRFSRAGDKSMINTDCAIQQQDLAGNWWTIMVDGLLVRSNYEATEKAIHGYAARIGMKDRFMLDVPLTVGISGLPEKWIADNQPAGEPPMTPTPPASPRDVPARPTVTARIVLNAAGSWLIQRLDQGGYVWIGAPYDGYDKRVVRISDEPSLRPTTFVSREQALRAISAFRGANGPDFDIAVEPTPVMFQIQQSPYNGLWFFFIHDDVEGWSAIHKKTGFPVMYRVLSRSFDTRASAIQAFGDWSSEQAPYAVELISADDVPALLTGEDAETVAGIMDGAFHVRQSSTNGMFEIERWRATPVGGHWSAVISECEPELWPWRQFDTVAEAEGEIVKYGHRVGQAITIVRGENEIASASPGYDLPRRILDPNGQDTGLIWKMDSPELTAFAEQCRAVLGWRRDSHATAALNTIVSRLVAAGWSENTIYRGLQGLQPFADEPDGLTVRRLTRVIEILNSVRSDDPAIGSAMVLIDEIISDQTVSVINDEPVDARDGMIEANNTRLDAVAEVLRRLRGDSMISRYVPSAIELIDEALAIATRTTPIGDVPKPNRFQDGRHAIATALSCLEALDHHLRHTGEGPNGGEQQGNSAHRADAIHYLKRHPQHFADVAEQLSEARRRQHALDCTMQADQPEQPPHANVAAHVPPTETFDQIYAASVAQQPPVRIETVTMPVGTNVPEHEGTFRIMPNLIEPAGGWSVQRWSATKGQWLTMRGENFPVSATYWDAVELVAQAAQRMGDVSRLAAPTEEQIERWAAKGFVLTAPPRAGDAVDVDMPDEVEPSPTSTFSVKFTVSTGDGLYAVDEWKNTGVVDRLVDDLTWKEVEAVIHPGAVPIDAGTEVGACEIRDIGNNLTDVYTWTGKAWKKIAGGVTHRTAEGVVKARSLDPENRPKPAAAPSLKTVVIKQWRELMRGVEADLKLIKTNIDAAGVGVDPYKLLNDVRDQITAALENLEAAKRGE